MTVKMPTHDDIDEPKEGSVRQNVGNAGKGRKKGALNKNTRVLKDAIIEAATQVGFDGKGYDGLVGYCKRLAVVEPKAFASLLGRIIPTQITGPEGGAIEVKGLGDFYAKIPPTVIDGDVVKPDEPARIESTIQ